MGRRRADKSFGRLLAKRAVDRIVPEAANRLEAGRRLYVKESIRATESELGLLTAERKRIEKEGGEESKARLARIDRLISTVTRDLATHKTVNTAIEKFEAPVEGGWTVFGRVLSQDHSVPKRAEVVFLSDDERAAKALGTLKPDAHGFVRKVYSADVVKKLESKGVRVTAAVRVGGRIVAKDPFAAPVRADFVHQFDLRTETAIHG